MLKLLGDRIAILPLEAAEKVGMIFKPEDTKERAGQGIVCYRGNETKDVRVGDHVIYPWHAGSRVSIEGEGLFVVIREDSIEAVIEGTSHNILLLNDVINTIDSIEARILRNLEGEEFSCAHNTITEVKAEFSSRLYRDSTTMEGSV